jgi:hypothetical protein
VLSSALSKGKNIDVLSSALSKGKKHWCVVFTLK